MRHGEKSLGSLKGSRFTNTSVDGHLMAGGYEATPAFTVDGIPALPGEKWQDYHDRALDWITIESRTIPANRRSMSLWQVAGLIALLSALGFLIGRI